MSYAEIEGLYIFSCPQSGSWPGEYGVFFYKIFLHYPSSISLHGSKI